MEQCLCGDPITLFLNHSKGHGNIQGLFGFFQIKKIIIDATMSIPTTMML